MEEVGCAPGVNELALFAEAGVLREVVGAGLIASAKRLDDFSVGAGRIAAEALAVIAELESDFFGFLSLGAVLNALEVVWRGLHRLGRRGFDANGSFGRWRGFHDCLDLHRIGEGSRSLVGLFGG